MATFETLEVEGFIPAMHGMRNPLKSHHKNDSGYFGDDYSPAHIGPNDYDLAKRLIQAGPEHCKFLRMITVWADWSLPRYLWSEADTYRIGLEKNSESTMHTLLKENFDETQFEWPPFENSDWDIEAAFDDYINVLKTIKMRANEETGENKQKLHRILKGMLPESFIQKRTVCVNYQTLRNMYHQRKNHRLPQWNTDFVNWVHTLPYSEFITDEWPEKEN